MSTLYFLGGPPRTGKSTIAARFIARKPKPLIATDALIESIRKLFVDDSFPILREIKISGYVKYKAPGTQELTTKEFDDPPVHENTLALRALLGTIAHYGRNNTDVIVEGCIFDPTWITRHTFAGFKVRVVFVGFTNDDHFDEIISHAKQNPSDWINHLLGNHNGDEAPVKERLGAYIEQSKQLAHSAPAAGFSFVDMSGKSFRTFVDEVVAKLGEVG